MQRVLRLDHYNCEECARAFYASAFVKNVMKKEMWVCYECAAKTPIRNNLYWRVCLPQNELLEYLSDKQNTPEQEPETADDRAKWLYAHGPVKRLEWFADLAPGECVIDVLKMRRKEVHVDRHIQQLEGEMRTTQESIDRTSNKNKRGEFERKLQKQTDRMSELKASKRKCQTAFVVLQARVDAFNNN